MSLIGAFKAEKMCVYALVLEVNTLNIKINRRIQYIMLSIKLYAMNYFLQIYVIFLSVILWIPVYYILRCNISAVWALLLHTQY